LYRGEVPAVRDGDVFGHEFTGVIEEAGPAVAGLKAGDRVVVSAAIACGECWFCQNQLFSLCDAAEDSPLTKELYGQDAGLPGYMPFGGGHDGGQAEYVRVPRADVNCLKLPPDLPDEKAVFLSETLCTGWHATELGGVEPGQVVAVFGCGPAGLMAQLCARQRGAKTIIAFDRLPYRLDAASRHIGSVAINVDEDNVLEALRDLTQGQGPDVCIEAVGSRHQPSALHKIEQLIKLETDVADPLAAAIRGVRKGGVVAVVGSFTGYAVRFPVGAMMQKGVTLRSGQVPVQRYWSHLMNQMREGRIDPSFCISHRMPLDRAPEAYRLFDRKEDHALKIILLS
jgi:threonine dehydrogenase-like Zn-dependent dehydrogenase